MVRTRIPVTTMRASCARCAYVPKWKFDWFERVTMLSVDTRGAMGLSVTVTLAARCTQGVRLWA
jgi:hypothetical protein